MVLMNLSAGQEQKHRCINRLADTETGSRRWDKLSSTDMSTATCKMRS